MQLAWQEQEIGGHGHTQTDREEPGNTGKIQGSEGLFHITGKPTIGKKTENFIAIWSYDQAKFHRSHRGQTVI